MTTPAALEQAFAALNSYDWGSSRSDLLPIDDAVRAAGNDPASAATLEQRLIDAISSAASVVARQYLFGKLAWIGSAKSVPILAQYLGDPQLADAARNALEALPGESPAKALRDQLSKLQGVCLIGAIQSLGARRDPGSVSALARRLRDTSRAVADAAAAALGRVGNADAGRILTKSLARGSGSPSLPIAHACLDCAAHLKAEGHTAEAVKLWRALLKTELPRAMREAAQRGVAVAIQQPGE
jgi:hypothetical protein